MTFVTRPSPAALVLAASLSLALAACASAKRDECRTLSTMINATVLKDSSVNHETGCPPNDTTSAFKTPIWLVLPEP